MVRLVLLLLLLITLESSGWISPGIDTIPMNNSFTFASDTKRQMTADLHTCSINQDTTADIVVPWIDECMCIFPVYTKGFLSANTIHVLRRPADSIPWNMIDMLTDTVSFIHIAKSRQITSILKNDTMCSIPNVKAGIFSNGYVFETHDSLFILCMPEIILDNNSTVIRWYLQGDGFWDFDGIHPTATHESSLSNRQIGALKSSSRQVFNLKGQRMTPDKLSEQTLVINSGRIAFNQLKPLMER